MKSKHYWRNFEAKNLGHNFNINRHRNVDVGTIRNYDESFSVYHMQRERGTGVKSMMSCTSIYSKKLKPSNFVLYILSAYHIPIHNMQTV